MYETIFHLTSEGNLIQLNEAPYISEDLLQQLLAQHPNLLAGGQIDSANPRRWLLVDREFGVPDDEYTSSRWSLDHLFIDQDGIPTLVEVKRSTDTRIRREVIGQILDYAANAVSYWTIDKIQLRFEEQCNISGIHPQDVINESLQCDFDADELWERVKTNLKAGKIRMLIVADTIPKELQRIIEFLNEQMSPAEILGLEVKQFVSQNNHKTLVPRVVGKTTTADNMKRKPTTTALSRQWDDHTFFSAMESKRGHTVAKVGKELLAFACNYTDDVKFGGTKRGFAEPLFIANNIEHPFFRMFDDGTMEIVFQRMREPFKSMSKRLKLMERINQVIPIGVNESMTLGRRGVNLDLLLDPTILNRFCAVLAEFLEESGIEPKG